jgi:hypothetical protein
MHGIHRDRSHATMVIRVEVGYHSQVASSAWPAGGIVLRKSQANPKAAESLAFLLTRMALAVGSGGRRGAQRGCNRALTRPLIGGTLAPKLQKQAALAPA